MQARVEGRHTGEQIPGSGRRSGRQRQSRHHEGEEDDGFMGPRE